jgi:hypothetical protein
MKRTDKGSVVPRFKVGDKVRAKPGVNDLDYPDMPLGGRSGIITDIVEQEGHIICVLELDERTVANIHPIYKQRCENDGLDYRSLGLDQEEIELDDGVPVPIEQPTSIVPRPLSPDDEDDRVRMVFGLTHDDPVPEVTEESLLAYHRYLAAHLSFPIQITSWEKSGPFASRKVTVAITGLVHPQEGRIDEEYGLIGLGHNPKGEEIEFPLDEIELGKKDPNRSLLSDYSYWFQNWR